MKVRVCLDGRWRVLDLPTIRRQGRRHAWTPEDDAVLRALYPTREAGEVARSMGLRVNQVHNRAQRLGIAKDPGFFQAQAERLLESGKQYRFRPGEAPRNPIPKGRRMSPATEFRRGHRPHNAVPIGAERISKDGIRQRKVTDTGYSPRDWQSVHSLLWVEHHGPIPDGHVVVFRDGDRTRIAIDNLELVSRAELMARNTIHRYPDELRAVMHTRRCLVRRINNAKRRTET